MIPPGTVATLRTTEIVVAYLVNIMITQSLPEIPNMFGALLVLLSAISLIFEKPINDKLSKEIFCDRYDKSNISYQLIHEEND